MIRQLCQSLPGRLLVVFRPRYLADGGDIGLVDAVEEMKNRQQFPLLKGLEVSPDLFGMGLRQRLQDAGRIGGDGHDQHFASIIFVVLAFDQLFLLQAVDEAGNRTGGQAGLGGEFAGRQLPLLDDQLQVFEVGGRKAGLPGDGFVKQRSDVGKLSADGPDSLNGDVEWGV